MSYTSQNNEAEVVINYFNGRIGRLLSFGENDGLNLSNSYDLIKLGWDADLFEPIKGNCDKIFKLHIDNMHVAVHNHGIATKTGWQRLHVSGGSVIAVLDKQLLKDWNYEEQYNIMCSFLTFSDAYEFLLNKQKYSFITIDCEGIDWEILQQMDLNEIGCECICLEQGNDPVNYERMKAYCAKFGLTKELLYNFENVILAR